MKLRRLLMGTCVVLGGLALTIVTRDIRDHNDA